MRMQIDHYDSLETRDPAERERETLRAASRSDRARDDRARLGEASRRHRSEIRHLARGARRSCRSCANPICRVCRSRDAAVRRLQRHAARQGEAPADVARSDLRAGRSRERLCRRRARACSPPASATGDIVLNCFSYHLTPGAWMFESGGAGARLRRHSRRRRQYRAAGRGDRAAQARRLYRHAGLSEGPARYRAEVRQGRIVDQARARLRRGAAAVAARRNCRRAASRCCNATPSPRPA